MVQSSSTTPDGAVKWRNRTFRRFEVADLWTTPPGPGWSRVVQGGPGWSSRSPLRAEPPCGETERRAQRGRQRDRTAASSNGPQWHVAPIAVGLQGWRGASPGWWAVDQAGPPLIGPGWSRVVQAARCGRGPAHHLGALRNRRAMRFHVDWPSMLPSDPIFVNMKL